MFKDILKAIRKELWPGISLWIVLGINSFIQEEFLGVGFEFGSVIAVTVIFILIETSIVASLVRLFLRKLRIDSVVVSGPFISRRQKLC